MIKETKTINYRLSDEISQNVILIALMITF